MSNSKTIKNARNVLLVLSFGVFVHGCSSSSGVSTSSGLLDGSSQTLLDKESFENVLINSTSRGVVWEGNAQMPALETFEQLYGDEPRSFSMVDIADYCHVLIKTSTSFDLYLETGADVFSEGQFTVKNDRFSYEGEALNGVFSASHRLADATGDKMLLVTVYNDDLRSIGQVKLQEQFGPLVEAELLPENRTMEFVVDESGVYESPLFTYGKITSITSYAACPE